VTVYPTTNGCGLSQAIPRPSLLLVARTAAGRGHPVHPNQRESTPVWTANLGPSAVATLRRYFGAQVFWPGAC